MSAKPNGQRHRQRRAPAKRGSRKPPGTGAAERRFHSHPLFGEIPLIPDPVHEGVWRYDPAYEPPMPTGAVRGDITRQEYCAAHHVPHYFYVDRALVCLECGEAFTFSADEQKHWYETLGFHHHADAVRCVACRRKRRSEKALNGQIARAKEALRESPDDPSHLLALAEATARLHEATGHGDLDGAIAAARAALRRMPRAVEALFWEGRCHQLAGREARAREAFERFLESNPSAPRLSTLRDEARRACDNSS